MPRYSQQHSGYHVDHAGRPRVAGTCHRRRGCPCGRPDCTFAATDALLFNVKVQVFVLLPLLEQAPDQTASRLFETLNVIDVPVANDADPVPPTAPSALKASS